MTASGSNHAIGLGVLGLLYGLVVGFLAMGLAGGGHGWNSAMISASGIFLLPTFGLSLADHDRDRGRRILLIVATVMLSVDLLLIVATWREGVEYAGRAWRSRPGRVILWAILWVAWQMALVGRLAWLARKSGRA